MAKKYIERYYKPNVLEISIAYNFYIISSLFAISSNNFISLYLSLELQSLSLISLIFVITFVLPALVNTSGEQTASPTVIEAAFKNFWLNMVFSYAILIGISLIYYSTGQTDISKAFMIINIYNTDPSLSILLVLIHLFIILFTNCIYIAYSHHILKLTNIN